MRIGIVTGEYPPMQGGVGAYSAILAHTLVEQGHEVFVYSSKQTKSDDARIFLTQNTGKWSFNSLRAIRQWAQTNRLDIINIQFQTAAYNMSPFIHFLPDYLRQIPMVTTFHDLRFPYLFPKAGKLRDWIVMHLARASGGVIVTNHEDYKRVKQLPCVTMIPIGSNILTTLPDDFERDVWRAKAGATGNDFLVAFFGFMNHSKGIETLLHSIAALRRNNIPIKLVIIGDRTGSSDPTNAAFASKIDTLIAQLELGAVVYWTGFVGDEQVSAYLAAADAVALPFLDGASYRRGTLMAAIHHGCAVVTTHPNVKIPEFVDGENMLLVPPGDTDALSLALRRLYESADLRTQLRKHAGQLATHFDWHTIAQETAQVFERVKGKSRA